MAKHNLILGTASRSLGDVTLYRRGGQQVARARVRNIANPRTKAQAFQRAIMAPITKFYAPLAGCLEKSWEGKNKAESYAAFIKKNIALARQNSWLRPKGDGVYPFPYQLSYGTLPSVNAYANADTTLSIPIVGTIQMQTDGTWGQLSTQLVNGLGIQDGDQLTFVWVLETTTGYIPRYARFFLDVNSTQQLNAWPDWTAIFQDWSIGRIGDPLELNFKTIYDGLVAGAVIVSRWENNKWRRSVETLSVNSNLISLPFSDAVIAEYLASYQTKENANPSDVYLNGSLSVDVSVTP